MFHQYQADYDRRIHHGRRIAVHCRLQRRPWKHRDLTCLQCALSYVRQDSTVATCRR
jgi:hypothetical protein